MTQKLTVLVMLAAVACARNDSHIHKIVPVLDVLVDAVNEVSVLVSVIEPATCDTGMVEVAGEFCPQRAETCLRWIDKGDDPKMCAEFAKPTKCLSKKLVPMQFCIDAHEWPNKENELPAVNVSWWDAKSSCESVGKRLCTYDESVFACEGQEGKPYPYGDGYHRDDAACGAGKKWIDPWKNSFETVDQRDPLGSHPNCVSDFGVIGAVAGVDEWVDNERGSMHGYPWRSGLHGGHFVAGVRNRCRAITATHSPDTVLYAIGYRCCKSLF